MSSIRVRRVLPIEASLVWVDLSDIARHVEWMEDAVAIRFCSERRTGVGTIFDCETRIGPFRLSDRMEVTEWVDGELIGIRHSGAVSGHGRLWLGAVGPGRSELVWEERLRFPWWLAGPLGVWLAKPLLKRIWTRNLQNFSTRFDEPAR